MSQKEFKKITTVNDISTNVLNADLIPTEMSSQLQDFPVINMKWANGIWAKEISDHNYKEMRWLFTNIVTEWYCRVHKHLSQLYDRIPTLDLPLPGSNMTPDIHYIVDERRIDVYEFKVSLVSINTSQMDYYQREAYRKYKTNITQVNFEYIIANEQLARRCKLNPIDTQNYYKMRNDLLNFASTNRTLSTELEQIAERIIPDQKDIVCHIPKPWMENKTPENLNLITSQFNDTFQYIQGFFKHIDKLETFLDNNYLECKDFMTFWKTHIPPLDIPFSRLSEVEQNQIKNKYGCRFYNYKHPWEKKNGYGRANYLILPPIHKTLSKGITDQYFLHLLSSHWSLSSSVTLILEGLRLQLANPDILRKLREINADIAYSKSSDLTDQDKHNLCSKYDIRTPISKKGHISLNKIRKMLADIGKKLRVTYNSADHSFKFSSHGNIQLRDIDKNRPLLELCGIGKKTQRKFTSTHVDITTLPTGDNIDYLGHIDLQSIFSTRQEYVPDWSTSTDDSSTQYINHLYGNHHDFNEVARVYMTDSLYRYNQIRRTPMAWFLNMYSAFYRGYITEMSNFSTKNTKMNEMRFFKHPQLPIWHLAGVPPNDQTTGPIICISVHDGYITEPYYLPSLHTFEREGKIIRISKPFRLALDIFSHSESYEWSYYGTEMFLKEFNSSMINTSMENLWLPSSRNITEFLDITYVVLKNIRSYGTYGRTDALKKLAIQKSNDVRVISWLINLERRWKSLNTLALTSPNLDLKTDPIYGIKASDISLIHNLAYLKQIQPKLDGLDKRKVLAGFFKDEIEYQSWWLNSPFRPDVTNPNVPMTSDEFYNKLWEDDGNWTKISYSPDVCFNVTKDLFDTQLHAKPFLAGRGFPKLSALEGVKTTKVLVAHNDDQRPGTEKGSYHGLHSIHLNEATYYSSMKFKTEVENNSSLYKPIFQESMPYVSNFTFGDTDPLLIELGWRQMLTYPPNSVLIMKLKDQQGFSKRAFFIQMESMRNLNRAMDEGFHEMLDGNPLDMLRIPGSEKLVHLQNLMQLMNYSPQVFKLILSEDQTKFGDTYPMEALAQQAKASYFCGQGPAIKVHGENLWITKVNDTIALTSQRTVVSLHRRAGGNVNIVCDGLVLDPIDYKFKPEADVDQGFQLWRYGSVIRFNTAPEMNQQLQPITMTMAKFPGDIEGVIDFELDEQGYLGFYETEFMMAVDRALTNRVILMPHETVELYNRIQRQQSEGKKITDPDMVKTVTEYVESFGAFLSNSFGSLDLSNDVLAQVTQNPYIVKKVGFTLGVLNTRGTLLSVCHTTMAMRIMGYAGLDNCFRGCTHSDDSIKYTDFRSVNMEELKHSQGKLTELGKKIHNGWKLRSIDNFSKFQLLNDQNEVVEFVSNTIVFKLMMAASLLSPRFVGQRPSLLKYSFGFTGEVLQTLHEGGEITEPSIRFITPLMNNLPNESYARDLATAISRTRPIIESFPSGQLISDCYIGLSFMMGERFGIPLDNIEPMRPLEWGGMYFALPALFYSQGVNSNEVRLQFMKDRYPHIKNIMDWSMNIPEIWKMRSREIDEIVKNVMDVKGFGAQTTIDVDEDTESTTEMPIIEYKKQFLIRFSKTAKASQALGKMLTQFWPEVRESFMTKYPKYRQLSKDSKDNVQQMREAYYFFQEEYLLRRNTFNLRVLRFFNKYTSRSYLEKYMKVPIGVKIAARVGYWSRKIPNQLLERYRNNPNLIISISDMWEQIYRLAISNKDPPSAVGNCSQLINHILYPLTSEIRGITIKDWHTIAQTLQVHHYPLRYRKIDQFTGPVTFSKDVPLLIGLMIATSDDSLNEPTHIIRGGYRAKRFIDNEELSKFKDLLQMSGFNNKSFLMKHHRFLIKLLTNKVYKPVAKLNENTPLTFSLTIGNSPILPMRAKIHEGLTEVQLRSFEIDEPTMYNVQTRLLLLAAFKGEYVHPECRIFAQGMNQTLIPLSTVIESALKDSRNRNFMDRVLVNFAARDPNNLDFYSYRVLSYEGEHRHVFGIRILGQKLASVFYLNTASFNDGYYRVSVTTNSKDSSMIKLMFYMSMYYLTPKSIRIEQMSQISDSQRGPVQGNFIVHPDEARGDFLVYNDETVYTGDKYAKPALKQIFYEEDMEMPDEKSVNGKPDPHTKGVWINGIYCIEYDKPMNVYTNGSRIFSRKTYVVCPYRIKSSPSGGKLYSPDNKVIISDETPLYSPTTVANYKDGALKTIDINMHLIKSINEIIELCKQENPLFPIEPLLPEISIDTLCQLRKLEIATLFPLSVLLKHAITRNGFQIVGLNQETNQTRTKSLNSMLIKTIKVKQSDAYRLVPAIQWVYELLLGDQRAAHSYIHWVEQVTTLTYDVIMDPMAAKERKLYMKLYRDRFTVTGGTPNNYIDIISTSDSFLYSLVKDITPHVFSRMSYTVIPLWGHGLIDEMFATNLRQLNHEYVNRMLDLLISI